MRNRMKTPLAPARLVRGAATCLLVACALMACPEISWRARVPFIGRALWGGARAESAPLAEGVPPAARPEAAMPPPVVLEDMEGYPVIARLTIERLSLELPVLAEVGDAALKVAPCLFAGPSSPTYPGNIVITGHNYRDKSHFGRLSELEKDDAVILMDKYGEVFCYEVYETLTIGPGDIEALETYEGEYGLALVTCADRGKNRLLVRCRASIGETPYP